MDQGRNYVSDIPRPIFRSGEKKENVPSDRILRDDFDGEPNWRPNEKGEVLNNDYFGGDLRGITEKLSYLLSSESPAYI